MAEQYEHLTLPLYSEAYPRAKYGGGGGREARTEPERVRYYEKQVQQIASLRESLRQDKVRYQAFLDPNLIFKLEVVDFPGEGKLIDILRGMDIAVLSPSPSRTGFWVVLSEDDEALRFMEKIEAYGTHNLFRFFNKIGELKEIPADEKIGLQLRDAPLALGEMAFLDLEIWRMEDQRLAAFVAGLEALVKSLGGRVTDQLVRDSFCLLRIQADQEILDRVLPLREIASVDRMPRPYVTLSMLGTPLQEISIGNSPSESATAIAVLDSGITSGHPLLSSAIGDEIATATRDERRIRSDRPVDDVGHGTEVAGIALYGDLRERLLARHFAPEVWILSAKVMYAETDPISGHIEARYDEEELWEHQLERAVRHFCQNYANCRVVNLSLGNDCARMYGDRRQFNLAALIDELARELGVIFVVAVGNLANYAQMGYPDSYPGYLLADTEETRLIDPASAALAITVGSIAQDYGPLNRFIEDIADSPARTGCPSPFTRVGPGYQRMVKPEVVAEGGNVIKDHLPVDDIGGRLLTLNHRWLENGQLFKLSYGTSLSAPKVANMLALLCNQYPNASANLIKALLISSATLPDTEHRPEPFRSIGWGSADSELMDLLRVYGYGKPNLQQALASSDQNVLLVAEGTIGLDEVDVYYFHLPAEFVETSGRRRMSVTLAYDPPVNKNRVDYAGCSMEFHLFRNMSPEDVVRAYPRIGSPAPQDTGDSRRVKANEVHLGPGTNTRKRGVHQHGVIEYTKRPDLSPERPLVLAVISQDRWIRDSSYRQRYAVVVSVEHASSIALYNLVRARNQERVRVTLR